MKFMQSMCFAITLFSLSIGCASVSEHASILEVPVEKFIWLRGDDPNFRTPLRLPCVNSCASVEDPEIWVQAVEQLSGAIDQEVSGTASEALQQACQESVDCKSQSDEVWDRFYEISRRLEIEKDHSLDEYISGIRVALRRVWRIGQTCEPDATFCASLQEQAVGSPEMLIETAIRSALWANAFGAPPSFSEILVSMGDMLRKR